MNFAAASPWLDHYEVQRRDRTSNDAAAWHTIATGTTSVDQGTLATLDTTLLQNGAQELRLTAVDWFGRTATTEPVPVVLEGHLKVGHLQTIADDLVIPAPGMPVTVERVYDSRDKDTGDFGIGNTTNLDAIHLSKTRRLGQDWYQYSELRGTLPVNFLKPTPPDPFPDDSTVSTEYDGRGRIISATDPLGFVPPGVECRPARRLLPPALHVSP